LKARLPHAFAVNKCLPALTIRAGTKVEIGGAVVVRPRKRILLVEDDTDLARLYRGVLRMAGFDARHAPDELPVGLMAWHGALHDDTILNVSLQIENLLSSN